MNGRRVLGLDVRPVVVFAVILLAGSLASRLVSGVAAVLAAAAVVVIGVAVAVVIGTVRGDARRNAESGAAWEVEQARQARFAQPALVEPVAQIEAGERR